jgi:hypothetical protein
MGSGANQDGERRDRLAELIALLSRPALVVLIVGAVLLQAAPAGARLLGPSPKPLPRLRSDTNTELVLTATGAGQPVKGFIADTENPFDPIHDGYPKKDPTTGFSPENPEFSGLVHGQPTGGGLPLSLYCIDIRTGTFIGFGYGLGAWDLAHVANVGYVARLLDDYYPNTPEPTALHNLNQKAAAVQAAIWYFSDRYVLSTSDPLHNSVVAIVEHVLSQGPVIEPPPPSLTLTPPSASGHAGSVVGPFTVTTDAPHATVTATGGRMFSNPAGSVPIDNGASVKSGQEIWIRSSGPTVAVLQASSQATVPSGNVYLYDGNGWADDAQELILARKATLATTVQATAEFLPPGSLTVKKTITGTAAGSQGSIVIAVACNDGVLRPDFVIPARATAGTRSRTYVGIQAGTVCIVNETSNGKVLGTDVEVSGDGQEVTIRSGALKAVEITDSYQFVGSLLVRKTIAGPAAGQQGSITIHTECDRTALSPDMVIAAGTPAGEQVEQYNDIPAPSTCTVTETADGQSSTVSVVVEGSGQTVPITAGHISEAAISDTYGLQPGQLEVTKTIAGPLAGQQGAVTIHTVCDNVPLTPDFVIPAATPAGSRSQIYSGIATPASCVVTETTDGHSGTVPVAVVGSPQTVMIPPGGAGPRIADDLQVNHGPQRRAAGRCHRPYGLQRHRALARLRDRRRRSGRHRLTYLRRSSGRLDVHRDRDG